MKTVNDQAYTFLRADKPAARLRRAKPVAICEARIVAVAGGYQLQAKLRGSADQWVLTTPGGVADTAGDASLLRQFASVVLSHLKISTITPCESPSLRLSH